MMVSTRQTAAERRVAVLSAAVTEFAKAGYAGTSTDAIANRAGISQPYLFRLFGTKKDLFIATFDQVGTRIVKELSEAAEGLDGLDALHAMGEAYVQLMEDPEFLQVQMHGYAAATGDPDIAASCRKTFEVLFHIVKDKLGPDEQMIQDFFAHGMLMSVMSAINLLSVREPWAESICPRPEKFQAVPAMSTAHNSGAATSTVEDAS
ncbi:MAG: TetR/AcrR family transcriptional regulator [Acidimicrobiales bacterium]